MMSSLLDKVMHEFVQATCSMFGEAVKEIILFGSHARNEANDESDIDVIYSSTRISGPAESFSDSSNYWGAHDFSGNATKGNYYRIKVTFSAEGESITRYSNIVYYD